jgi:hypothetical protein
MELPVRGGRAVRRPSVPRVSVPPHTTSSTRNITELFEPDNVLVASYWPVFKDIELRNRYNMDILTRNGVSKVLVVTLWIFLITVNFLFGVASSLGLRGKYGTMFQLWTMHAVVMALSQLLLTVHVLLGDDRVAKYLTFFGIESPHSACRLREGLTLNYLINNCMSIAVAHFLRTMSAECTLETPVTELHYCNQIATPGISPICLDSLLFYILFMLVYQLAFTQLKWIHYFISWAIGLVFVVLIVVVAIGRGRLPVQSVPQTVLYVGVYFGTYMIMCTLHQSKLQSYLTNARVRLTARVDSNARQQLMDRSSSSSNYSSTSSVSSISFPSGSKETLAHATYDFRGSV